MSESLGFRPRPHPAALVSLLLGLASFAFCLLGVSGLPALVIGLRALRAVNASEGKYTGARMAVAGMALGGLGTVLTVAGLLAILIVQAQANAARTNCKNNLRQLGLSLERYAQAHDSFPAAVVGPRDLPPHEQLSWLSSCVPLLGVTEESPKTTRKEKELSRRYLDLFGSIDPHRGWEAPANAGALDSIVRVFRCPSSPGLDLSQPPGLTNYVGLAGVGPGAAALKREAARAGAFGYDRGAKPADFASGTTYTIDVLETARDLGPWLAGGEPTVRELDPDLADYCGPGRPFGGLHSGSMNVLYADGSVRPISDRIDPEVLRGQATLSGQRR